MKKIFIALLVCAATLFADEGMWLLDQLQDLNLEEHGLELKTSEIWNETDGGLSQAVVSLGGCTASFVSPDGLIATNFHCARSAIQKNSTKEKNLLETGFLAKELSEELSTRGTNVYVLNDFKDVTDLVLKGADNKDPKKRQETIDKNITKIEKKAEKANKNIRAKVRAMNHGLSYTLFESLKITDVRLVYSPPASIGKFGGDIDNFEWPRHTGDYSFLRAYVGADGNPAEFSTENVPFQPKKWLKTSLEGYEDDDMVMVIGYPGRTSRHITSYQVEYYENFHYPWRIHMLTQLIDIIKDRRAEDKDADVKLASKDASMNNSLKNSLGQRDGFVRTNVLDKKKAAEKEFLSFINANQDRQKEYGDLLPQFEKLYSEYKTFYPKYYWYYWLKYSVTTVGSAAKINKWSVEKEKPELDREPDYTDKDIKETLQKWDYSYRNFDLEFEKRVTDLFFTLARELPEGQKVQAIENIPVAEQADFIENLFEQTKLTKLETRKEWMEKSAKELAKVDDSIYTFVSELEKELAPSFDKKKEFDGERSRLNQLFMAALQKWQGGLFYPDANSTKRLTYGRIKGYAPRDAVWYTYFTTHEGIEQKHAKHNGADPFFSPQEQLDGFAKDEFEKYRDKKTGKLNVNFLTTLDTTGGNSGSPVLNAKGELVGLLFDGNYESIVADFIFDEPFTRSICVDMRYIIWLMENIHGANHLVKEMQL